MKTKRIAAVNLFFFVFFQVSAYGRTCNDDYYDLAQSLTRKYGKEIVNGYGGGQDMEVDMDSCSYNSVDEDFETEIEIKWNGALFRDNKYEIDGKLRVKSDGSGAEFAETYANENVKNLRFTGAIVGGMIVLGAIAADKEKH